MKVFDEKIFNLFKWILLMILYIALNVFSSAIIKSFNIKNELLLNIVCIIVDILITLLFIFIYRKDFKDKFKELNNSEGNKVLFGSLKIWFIGLILMITANVILNSFIGSIAENEAANRVILNNYYFYALITMVITGPICEEILFRLSISKIFDSKTLYILFSGLMFGLVHVIGESGLQLLYIIPYAMLGFSFAYMYRKYNNILCSIIMHTLHNLMCILIIFFL